MPKTIDGDLKNANIATSFGFDTACKVIRTVKLCWGKCLHDCKYTPTKCFCGSSLPYSWSCCINCPRQHTRRPMQILCVGANADSSQRSIGRAAVQAVEYLGLTRSLLQVFSELVGNIMIDSVSAKKYYHFVRLMGRAASHITLEAALQTHPQACTETAKCPIHQLFQGSSHSICI